MAENAKHSPTPWHGGQLEGGWIGIYAGPDDELLIGRVEADDVGDEVAIANGEFLFRAVNAHDDLLAACKELLLAMSEDCDSFDELTAMENSEKAIAKATNEH